jgi:hypothetical protein
MLENGPEYPEATLPPKDGNDAQKPLQNGASLEGTVIASEAPTVTVPINLVGGGSFRFAEASLDRELARTILRTELPASRLVAKAEMHPGATLPPMSANSVQKSLQIGPSPEPAEISSVSAEQPLVEVPLMDEDEPPIPDGPVGWPSLVPPPLAATGATGPAMA